MRFVPSQATRRLVHPNILGVRLEDDCVLVKLL